MCGVHLVNPPKKKNRCLKWACLQPVGSSTLGVGMHGAHRAVGLSSLTSIAVTFDVRAFPPSIARLSRRCQ